MKKWLAVGLRVKEVHQFFEGISVELEVEPEKDMYKEDDQEDQPWNETRGN